MSGIINQKLTLGKHHTKETKEKISKALKGRKPTFGFKGKRHTIETFCNPNNLITLCNKCNIKVNFNRKNWIGYFKGRIQLKKIIEKL